MHKTLSIPAVASDDTTPASLLNSHRLVEICFFFPRLKFFLFYFQSQLSRDIYIETQQISNLLHRNSKFGHWGRCTHHHCEASRLAVLSGPQFPHTPGPNLRQLKALHISENAENFPSDLQVPLLNLIKKKINLNALCHGTYIWPDTCLVYVKP